MLICGDKIKLINSIENFNCIGKEFEVTGISEDNMISFRSDFGVGMMTWKEFDRYFEKVVETIKEKPKFVWGEWIDVENDFYGSYKYKTNNKKVIVRKQGIQAESCCCKTDIFDLNKGLKLCLARINIKNEEAVLAELLNG